MENAFLKKAAASSPTSRGSRALPADAGEEAEHPIRMMARILGVSRSGFCSWLAGGCPEDDWSAEREAVRRVRLKPDRRFGFRFVKRFLPAEFSGLSLYRVRNLMRELGIRGRTPNVRKRTVAPDPKGPTWCGATSPAPSPPISSSATPPACAPARGGSTCPRR